MAGLLATTGVDIATAAHRGGSNTSRSLATSARHSGSGADLQSAYIAGVRRAAVQVYDAVGPVQVVFNDTIDDSTNAVFSAKDSLSRNDAAVGLASAAHQLRSLTVPATDETRQRQLIAAVGKLQVATRALRTLRDDTDEKLFNDVSGGPDSKVVAAESAWDAPLHAVFAAAHQKSPRGFEVAYYPHLRATKTSWIYGADHATLHALEGLRPIGRLRAADKASPSISRGEDIDEVWRRVLTQTAASFRSLHRPSGSAALPFSLRQRLPLLAENAKIFQAQFTALQHRDVAGLIHSQTRLREFASSLHGLALAMRAYGAVEAAGVVDVWAGHRPHVASHGSSSLTT